jgi:tetratricopeptide (TPR) repeat protein
MGGMDTRQLTSYAYHNCEFRRVLDLSQGGDAELQALRIKALCELDDKSTAVRQAQLALARFPEDGALHYLLGMSLYLDGSPKAPIEAAFLAATECGYTGGNMGLAFLEFIGNRTENALNLLMMARCDEPELDHIRRLMMFQILAVCQELTDAETQLGEADRILAQNPSLLRQLWGQLCWVRLLRAKGRFDGAQAVVERILAQVDERATPRLYRNAREALRMVLARREDANLILPPDAANESPQAQALGRIRRKPMLHSLYAYLSTRGRQGACKEEIVQNVWAESYNPVVHDDRIYKTIGRLRKLLGDDLAQPRFLTQVGRNYVLNLPVGGPESTGET